MVVDRKIKNYEASIELLEDRLKILNYFGYIMYCLAAIIFIISTLYYSSSGLVGPTVIGIGFSLFVFMTMFWSASQESRIGILIYLKKKDEEVK